MIGIAIGNFIGKGNSGVASWKPQYYVSNAGNDALDGKTLLTAWQTIAKVNSTVQSGDTIYFRKGDLWTEQLTTNLLDNITIDAYGIGINPIIDGSYVKTGWANDSAAIYYITSLSKQASFANGARLINKASKVTMIAGSQFWDTATKRMYIWLADSSDPNNAIMQLTSRDFGVKIGNSLNVDIKNISCQRQRSSGIIVNSGATSAQLVNIDSCSTTYIGSFDTTLQNGGIGIVGNSAIDRAQNVTIKNSTINNCLNNAIELSFVDTILILMNTIDSCDQGIELWRSVNNYTIARNSITNIFDIALGTGQIGHKNAIWVTDTTVAAGTGGHGIGSIHNNILSTSYQALLDLGCGTVEFFNNVVYNGSYSKFGTWLQATALGTGATALTLKNNIFYSSYDLGDYAFQVTDNATLTADYNFYYGHNGVSFKYGALNTGDWATWKAGGQDAHSYNANQWSSAGDQAVFVTAGSDWNLAANSRCINHGVDVGLTQDYLGNPIVGVPDIGAYEKQ